jgi:hypothetical protein
MTHTKEEDEEDEEMQVLGFGCWRPLDCKSQTNI